MLRGKRVGYLIATLGAVAFILQGYDQALMNGIIVLQDFVQLFPSVDTLNTTGDVKKSHSTLQGTVVALYEVGSAFGAASCYFIGDRLGRRKTIFIGACIIVVGVILQATPFHLAQLIVGRIVTGVGVGMFTATIPVWVSECSKAHNRGMLVMLSGFFGISGVALVTWMEFGLYYVQHSSAAWRFPIAFQSIFALAVLSCIFLLPESPRWLVASDKHTAAAKVLAQLDDLPESSPYIQHDLELIQHSLAAENGHDANPFSNGPTRHRWRTLLALSINILAQMSGVNIIAFYSDIVFTDLLHYPPTTARLITGCLQTWQALSAGAAVLLIDRFGRRHLLLLCFAGMAISQAAFAALTSVQPNRAAAGASLLFDFVALFCFPVGLFVVPFLYTAEIVPLPVRGKVAAMGTSVNWLFNFLLAEITPRGFADVGWRYYLVYVCTNVLGIAVVYLFAPETKGRSLEDIDAVWRGSRSPLDVVASARRLRVADGEGVMVEEKEAKAAVQAQERELYNSC